MLRWAWAHGCDWDELTLGFHRFGRAGHLEALQLAREHDSPSGDSLEDLVADC